MPVIESCHSTWVFDEERMRFRRILRHIAPGAHPVSTDWRPYFELESEPDSEFFTVVLNREGTRLLRSWRHSTECTQCSQNVTAEMSLAELGSALGR